MLFRLVCNTLYAVLRATWINQLSHKNHPKVCAQRHVKNQVFRKISFKPGLS